MDATYPSVCYYLTVISPKSRGMTVGGTLLAVAVLAALAAALASLCVTHIRTSNRAESALHASNLARSAIAQAIAEVLNDQEYGVGQLPEETVTVETEHGTGYLSFNPDLAEENGVVYSTNNAAGTTTVEGGQGRVVPANSVHLVALGSSGGVVRKVETVLSVPSFPWALAANGQVVIREGAMVGSLPEGVWPPSLADLEPADLVSNSTSDTAILLGTGSRVLGDVETPGKVVLADSTVQVDGQIREAAEPNTLPQMKAEDFDPAVLEIAFDDLTGLSGASLTSTTASGGTTSGGATTGGFALSGAARHDGDFQIDQDVVLSGAVLYVDGDLTVNGNIQGNGIVVVNGDSTVSSGVTLDGATKVAIVSAGKVTLRGVGPTSSSIRGLFYAEDGLLAEEITVVGALIAAGPDAGVELVNSRALSQSVQAASSGTTGTTGGTSGGSGPGGSGGATMTTVFKEFLDGGGEGGGGVITPPTVTPDTPGSGGSDASNFIPLKERIRVVSWFES